MSEREKNAGWVYPEGHESPKGVTQRGDASAHGDVGLRPSVVSVSNHEAANPTYGIEVCEQFGKSAKLEQTIKVNLRWLGYGG